MYYWFVITLDEKVPTCDWEKGSDVCVCKAESEDDAVRQLLPEMRRRVVRIEKKFTMQDCYRKSSGVLRAAAY